jgi:hypothetical protein
VALAVRDRLAAMKPAGVIAAAACGAGILVLEVARALGIPFHIVLPFSVEEFRKASVADRPGDWGQRFDALVAEARHFDAVVVLPKRLDMAGAITAANEALLVHAAHWAKTENAIDPARGEFSVTTLAIRDRKTKAETDDTAHFIHTARTRGHQVVEISTLV